MGKCIQFKLWEECNNLCSFCYLKGKRTIPNAEEKTRRLEDAKSKLDSIDYGVYDRIGLIGGDFFLGELTGIEESWLSFMDALNDSEAKQIWLATSLVQKDIGFLLESVSRLGDKDVLICTSYDTVGRFTEATKSNWFDNVNKLVSLGIKVHITSIITDEFISEYTSDMFPKECEVNLCEPHLSTEWYCSVNKGNYHEHLVKDNTIFNLPKRNKFISFISRNRRILKNYINYFNSHSNDIIDYDEHISSGIKTDRMDSNNHDANDVCGHPYFCHFYSDSDKCAMCDAVHIYESIIQ